MRLPGGGAYCDKNSAMTNCLIYGMNSAAFGGGLYQVGTGSEQGRNRDGTGTEQGTEQSEQRNRVTAEQGRTRLFRVKYISFNMLRSFSLTKAVLQLNFCYQKLNYKNHVCPE